MLDYKDIKKNAYFFIFLIISFCSCKGMQDELPEFLPLTPSSYSYLSIPQIQDPIQAQTAPALIPVTQLDSDIEISFEELNFSNLKDSEAVDCSDRIQKYFDNTCFYNLSIKNKSNSIIALNLKDCLSLNDSFIGDYPVLNKSEIFRENSSFFLIYIGTGVVIPSVLIGASFMPLIVSKALIPKILALFARITGGILGAIGNAFVLGALLLQIFNFRKLRKNFDNEFLNNSFIGLLQQNRAISFIDLQPNQEAAFILCIKKDTKAAFEQIKDSLQVKYEFKQDTTQSYQNPGVQFPGLGNWGQFAINACNNIA
ncbi:MAG: hypothetical protein WC436_03485 [Candidatus Babeliales bacterium]